MRVPRLHLFQLWALLIILSASAPCPAGKFPLREGDLWVMAGDRITAQHLHSNYFEAFCFARYPQLHFAFRNAAVRDHTVAATLQGFDLEIAAWNPTVVSVELGINDRRSSNHYEYIGNMETLIQRIRAIHARPVLFSPSAINDVGQRASLGPNRLLQEYTQALKELAAREKVPFADQFHPLLGFWNRIKQRDPLKEAVKTIEQQQSKDANETPVDDPGSLLPARPISKDKPSPLAGGDPVYPGPAGQLVMAAALLKGLGADGFVSTATLDATGKVINERGCKVEAVTAQPGKVAFDRLDHCRPFPIPDEARDAMTFDPDILALSQYTLTVIGLKKGRYALRIDGVLVATMSSDDLATGINLTALRAGLERNGVNPIVFQSRAILGAVAAKEELVSQWRTLSAKAHASGAAADVKEKLAAFTAQLQQADEKIRDAAKPRKLHFELSLPRHVR